MSEYCLTCGSMVEEYDSAYYSRNMLCIPCYDRKIYEIRTVSCAKCGMGVKQDEAKRRPGGQYCSYCSNELERLERAPKCAVCRLTIESWQKTIKSPAGTLHQSCADSKAGHFAATMCSLCGKKKEERMRISAFGQPFCADCIAKSRPGSERTALASFVDRIGAMIG